MNREEFLEEVWCPYPSVKRSAAKGSITAVAGEWMDVSTFVGAAAKDRAQAVVCGNWRPKSGSIHQGLLEFGGQSIDVRFDDKVKWLEPQRKDVEFDCQWLVEGDLISIQGCVGQGKALDEGARRLKIQAESMLLLAPRLENAPTWNGFDFETSRDWQRFVTKVRSFFSDRNFVEAHTPTLVPSPGTEPFLETFSTEWRQGSRKVPFFLPTSPEFHLKKMIARGWPRLFEIKTCFRNEEIGPHHQAEFTMLEWYRAFSNLDVIADDVEALLSDLSKAFGKHTEPLLRTTVSELFARAFWGFELTPKTTRTELVDLAKRVGIETRSDDTWDEIYFRLFLERIEPELGFRQPTLVHGYPATQAALSRIGVNGFADRFEIYWRGLEIANAFHELNDPKENVARFEEDARVRRAMGKVPVPRDEALVAAMRSGFPPSGGIALGMERLFMALFEIPMIDKTRAFPLLDQ